jgi:hypothetical protein
MTAKSDFVYPIPGTEDEAGFRIKLTKPLKTGLNKEYKITVESKDEAKAEGVTRADVVAGLLTPDIGVVVIPDSEIPDIVKPQYIESGNSLMIVMPESKVTVCQIVIPVRTRDETGAIVATSGSTLSFATLPSGFTSNSGNLQNGLASIPISLERLPDVPTSIPIGNIYVGNGVSTSSLRKQADTCPIPTTTFQGKQPSLTVSVRQGLDLITITQSDRERIQLIVNSTTPNDCKKMAEVFRYLGSSTNSPEEFTANLGSAFLGHSNITGVMNDYAKSKLRGQAGNGIDFARAALDIRQLRSAGSFKPKYVDDIGSGGEDQSHHIVMAFMVGFGLGSDTGLGFMNLYESIGSQSSKADIKINEYATRLAGELSSYRISPLEASLKLGSEFCN